MPGRQVIPRPPESAPGRPAPWAQLDPEIRGRIDLARVLGALERWQPQAAGAMQIDGFPDPGSNAAVLVALFEEAGAARVLLTRRAGTLRTHTGEVSFPGGRLEPGETPEDGARREAFEEIGLEPGALSLVGRLSVLTTFVSAATITPVVGLLGARPVVAPNPQEVAHVFDVALSELSDPALFREERWRIPGRPRTPATDDGGWFPVWFFELSHDTVWGATARMLVELLRLVLGV